MLAVLVALAGALDPIDPIAAYLDASAPAGQRVVYENHWRRVLDAHGACVAEWPDPAPGDPPLGLSWGCVVLHPRDVARFYALVERGAVVVIR